MKTLLLAAAVAMISTAAHACTLSDGDYESLAASPSKITRDTFPQQTAVIQKSICGTRAFVNQVRSQGWVIFTIAPYNTKYMNSDETTKIDAASDALMSGEYTAKGFGVA